MFTELSLSSQSGSGLSTSGVYMLVRKHISPLKIIFFPLLRNTNFYSSQLFTFICALLVIIVPSKLQFSHYLSSLFFFFPPFLPSSFFLIFSIFKIFSQRTLTNTVYRGDGESNIYTPGPLLADHDQVFSCLTKWGSALFKILSLHRTKDWWCACIWSTEACNGGLYKRPPWSPACFCPPLSPRTAKAFSQLMVWNDTRGL